MQPIQMQLSQNQKNFFEVFCTFPESKSNSKYLHKEDECQKPFHSEITD